MSFVDDQQIEALVALADLKGGADHCLLQPRRHAEHPRDRLTQGLLGYDESDPQLSHQLDVLWVEEVGEACVCIDGFIGIRAPDVAQELDEVDGHYGLPGAGLSLDRRDRRSAGFEPERQSLDDLVNGGRLIRSQCLERRELEQVPILDLGQRTLEEAVGA